jgi:uncharacterized protein YggU (UPF0235/DUF167 family)
MWGPSLRAVLINAWKEKVMMVLRVRVRSRAVPLVSLGEQLEVLKVALDEAPSPTGW